MSRRSLLVWLPMLVTLLTGPSQVLASGEPPTINVWYGTQQSFGQIGKPQRWINILGNVSDPDGVVSLVYSLNGGPQISLGIGPDTRRLQRPGDFNVNLDSNTLLAGLNTVELTATDALNEVSTQMVEVTYTPGVVWPHPYTIDWSTVTNLTDVAQVVDGLWTFDADGVRPEQMGYDRIIAIGDVAWDAFEVTVPVTINDIDPNAFGNPVSIAPGLGISLRWQGHSDWGTLYGGPWQPIIGWLPQGGNIWYDWGQGGGTLDMSGEYGLYAPDPQNHHFTIGGKYWIKFRVESILEDVAQYSAKVWLDGEAEPTEWTMTGIEGPGDLPSGSILLIAHHVDATFGNVTVVPLSNPNPPILLDLDVQTTETEATITWRTSKASDSTIHYGETPAYEIGTMDDPNFVEGHSITLTGLSPGTRYYFDVSSSDPNGLSDSSGGEAFVTAGIFPNGLKSDDFSSGVLDPNTWTFVDPIGNCSLTMTGRQAEISLPAGQDHDVWVNGNNAPRLTQFIADTDFEVETRFESALELRYQTQGITVEQDYNTFIRCEFFNDGSNVYMYVAFIDDGAWSQKLLKQLPGSDGRLWMRVGRVGNGWTVLKSDDGVIWTQEASFIQTMVVTGISVYASNLSDSQVNAPAFTSIIDYFFDTSNPIVPEDGGQVSLDIDIIGDGSVTRDPNLPIYMLNDVVQLTAIPEPGSTFLGWSGAGIADPNSEITTVSMDIDRRVTAMFSVAPDVTPPVISDVVLTPSSSKILVTWTTDEPANSSVLFGLTPAYELGSVDNTSFTTDHSALIDGLSPETEYHIEIFCSDASSNVGSSGPMLVSTTEMPPSILRSNGFDGASLDPNLWTFVDPLGGSTMTVGGGHVQIDVPMGINHDEFGGPNIFPRIMQPANDVNFDVVAKFDSVPSVRYQIHGFIIEQSPYDYIRLEMFHDGTQLIAFAASYVAGHPTIRIVVPLGNTYRPYQRVTRNGNLWTHQISVDGQTWQTTGQFTHSMEVTAVGMHVANSTGTVFAPAYSGMIDYFLNTADPLYFPVTTNIRGHGTVLRNPDAPSYLLNSTVELTATPDPGWKFDRWIGDASGSDPTIILSMNEPKTVRARFVKKSRFTGVQTLPSIVALPNP